MHSKIIEAIELPHCNKRIETQLQNIATGIYNYKFVFGNQSTTGKLTIIK